MADHKAKHKHVGPTAETMRIKRRQAYVEIRKGKRSTQFNNKRLHLEEEQLNKAVVPLEETEAACYELVHKGRTCGMSILHLLRRAFTQGATYIDVFFRVNNCLQSLIGLLTKTDDVDLQIQAAWCLTNIATGRPEHSLAVAKAAAPYFITYVSGSSPLLQDECAWALGNLAADTGACCAIIHSQGCLPPLVRLLQSPVVACVKSGAFAISNLIREHPDIARDAVKQGILPLLLKLLQRTDVDYGVMCEAAWVVTYLASTEEIVTEMVALGFLPVVVDIVVHDALTGQAVQQEGEVTTPMLRALGNICTGPSEYSVMVCENARLMPALMKLLECPISHIVKEAVWVISNMTCEYSVSQSVSYGTMLRLILSQLDKCHDVQTEAMYTLCNMATHGETVCAELVAHGAVAKVVPLLKSFDLEILHMALTFFEATLRYCDSASFMLEECNGVHMLEQLESHPNSDIHSQAQDLLDIYFPSEDDDNVSTMD